MRLATFNILHGRSPSDGLVDLDRLADAVRALDPDILALQEVDRLQPRSQLADLTAVAADAMGAVAHQFVAALSGAPGARWMAATGLERPDTAAYGISLLSRYPADSWQVLRLPRIPVRFPLWLPGPRKVIIVHEEPRSVMIGQFRTPAGPLVVANAHLSFVPGWGRGQLIRIRNDLEAFADPVVLMGDLNMPALARRESPDTDHCRPSHVSGGSAESPAGPHPAAQPLRRRHCEQGYGVADVGSSGAGRRVGRHAWLSGPRGPGTSPEGWATAFTPRPL